MTRPRSRPYTPKRGDVCRFNVDPPADAQEFGKDRPCLVISATDYNRVGANCIVVPITSQDDRPSAFTIPVPPGLVDATQNRPLIGLIACDFPRAISYRHRDCQFCCHVDDIELMREVVSTVLDVIDPLET